MAPQPNRPTRPIRPAGAAPITLAPTSVAAFVGWIGAGPVAQPTLVQSWSAFEQTFGILGTGELAYAVYGFFQNGGQSAYVVRVASQGAAPPAPTALAGALAQHSGVYALDGVHQFNLLCLPDLRRLAAPDHARVATAAAAYCAQRRAMLLLDLPARVVTGNFAAAQSWARGAAAEFGAAAANVAAYWPEPVVQDPSNPNAPRQVAASGMVAGIYAGSDASRGVWAAPAGIGAQLTGVERLAASVTDQQAGALAPLNPLRTFAASGTVVWGARTLAGGGAQTSQWTYVPVRRLALAIEDSLAGGLVWAAFEPNGPALWSQIALQVNSFLEGLFRQGAFKGQTPASAYFAHCDASTTTASDIASGVVDIVVGFAPLAPAQFVVLSINQAAGPAG